ncbi:MAG: ABC transporter ATP-binding protein, partial [Acidimicrobiia bacterium]
MTAPAVLFSGLTKRFGDKLAVDSVTAEIPAGSFFGICGPNGAGKTTMLRMACGLLRPDAGRVEVAGHDVWVDPVTAKSRLGMVPDNPSMFTRLTGRELIEFTGLLRGMDAEVVNERATNLLRLLDLEEAAGVLVADYSLGMAKKAAIACALLHNPRVLFLDEPFAGIDP